MPSIQTTDAMVNVDEWSDLSQLHEKPNIDLEKLAAYRLARLRNEKQALDIALCIMVNPVSLRYALNYSNYALFSAHIPCTYLFLCQDSYIIHNAFDPSIDTQRKRVGQPISHFYGGDDLQQYAKEFAVEVKNYLLEMGLSNRRIAIEHVNPSITQALEQAGLEVLDGALVSENARLIKSAQEVECIKWAMKVAEHGADRIKKALQPGVTEAQLWALLNYTNLANCGEWHDGKMLASGSRINPWLQEASDRKIVAGDLIGFDTDMVGPMGYFADLSRTFHCGPQAPTKRQKQLYQLAHQEIENNLTLLRDGVSFAYLQENAFAVPEEYHHNAYPCIVHGVGMCDEFPHIPPAFREPLPYQGELKTGMVVCVESYMGAVGERDGVKLEQQVLITDTGYELISTYPYEDSFME